MTEIAVLEDLLIPLVQSASLSALVVVAYGYVRRYAARHWPDEVQQIALGGLFGLAGMISMMAPVSPWPGVVVDGHSVMLALAALFVGPIGAATAALFIAGHIGALGGIGALAGIVAVVAVTLTSIGAAALLRHRRDPITWRSLVALGLAVSVASLPPLLLLPDPVLAPYLIRILALPMTAANLIGVLLSGVLLLQEGKRREVELMLWQAKETAEEANRAKSQFLATMSHELRTPLNAVIGFADTLEHEIFGPLGHKKYREYAGHIRSSGHHLLRLINDVLDLSKVEAGSMAFVEDTFDLRVMVAEAVRMLTPRAKKAGISLRWRTAADVRYCHGDELRLKQALLNLLANAIKFTPSGGKVQVSVRVDADGRLTLAVKDTGIGIAKADLARLFVPFSQIGNPQTRIAEGAGLGLVIAQRIVQEHGGTLSLDSEAGRGTTAWILLPASRRRERDHLQPVELVA